MQNNVTSLKQQRHLMQSINKQSNGQEIFPHSLDNGNYNDQFYNSYSNSNTVKNMSAFRERISTENLQPNDFSENTINVQKSLKGKFDEIESYQHSKILISSKKIKKNQKQSNKVQKRGGLLKSEIKKEFQSSSQDLLSDPMYCLERFSSSDLPEVDENQCPEQINQNQKKHNVQNEQVQQIQKNMLQPKQIIQQIEKQNNQFSFKKITFLGKNKEILEDMKQFLNKECQQQPNPYYLKNHQNISWHYRAMLLSWTMEVSQDFCLKRETYYLSTNFFDRFLSSIDKIEKAQLQLIGVTTLFMASKMEEIYPHSVKSFAFAAGGCYSIELILKTEFQICKALKFKLNPVTPYTLSVYYIQQFDDYIKNQQDIYDIMCFKKQEDEDAYLRYREFFQFIDTIFLDYSSLQYNPKKLISAMLYIVGIKNLNIFNSQYIFSQLQDPQDEFLSEINDFNHLFNEFYNEQFGFKVEDIIEQINFCAKYAMLTLAYQFPTVMIHKKEQILKGHYEDFLAYQTFNQHSLQYIEQLKELEIQQSQLENQNILF